MTEQESYLRAVDRRLRGIAAGPRRAVLDDLRTHFADAADAGRPVDEIIRSLGSPDDILARAREEFGADDAGDAHAERAWRVLQLTAVVVSVVIGVVTAFIIPSYAEASISTSSDGVSVSDTALRTMFEAYGIGVALIALIPALIAAVPLAVPARTRTLATAISGALLTFAALIGGFTIGGYFLPGCLLVWAALVLWVRLRGRGFGTVGHVIGGVLAALPVLIALPATVTGTVTIGAWGWVALAAIVVLAVLVAIGMRAAGWILAALGAVVLIAGLISGQLFTLLLVWLGGWWLTIGLAHAVSGPRAPRA